MPADRSPHTEPSPAAPPAPRPRWSRVLWWLLAYLALAVGITGILLPVLPTVPFILLSAFAAARGSERLHQALLAHPRTGPLITDWQEHGAINRRTKWLATATMVLCAVVLFLVAPKLWIPFTVTAIMLIVGTWIWFRPEP